MLASNTYIDHGSSADLVVGSRVHGVVLDATRERGESLFNHGDEPLGRSLGFGSSTGGNND